MHRWGQRAWLAEGAASPERAVLGPAGHQPRGLCDRTAGGLLRVAEGRRPICAHGFCYKHTCNAIRFKCFQAGASQRKYLLTVNICGLEESSAGDGDAVSNLITFFLTRGWVSVSPGASGARLICTQAETQVCFYSGDNK